ncbi:MAG: hypothetical protein MHM6MM_003747 [Cercozoa sp. M6MM]
MGEGRKFQFDIEVRGVIVDAPVARARSELLSREHFFVWHRPRLNEWPSPAVRAAVPRTDASNDARVAFKFQQKLRQKALLKHEDSEGPRNVFAFLQRTNSTDSVELGRTNIDLKKYVFSNEKHKARLAFACNVAGTTCMATLLLNVQATQLTGKHTQLPVIDEIHEIGEFASTIVSNADRAERTSVSQVHRTARSTPRQVSAAAPLYLRVNESQTSLSPSLSSRAVQSTIVLQAEELPRQQREVKKITRVPTSQQSLHYSSMGVPGTYRNNESTDRIALPPAPTAARSQPLQYRHTMPNPRDLLRRTLEPLNVSMSNIREKLRRNSIDEGTFGDTDLQVLTGSQMHTLGSAHQHNVNVNSTGTTGTQLFHTRSSDSQQQAICEAQLKQAAPSDTVLNATGAVNTAPNDALSHVSRIEALLKRCNSAMEKVSLRSSPHSTSLHGSHASPQANATPQSQQAPVDFNEYFGLSKVAQSPLHHDSTTRSVPPMPHNSLTSPMRQALGPQHQVPVLRGSGNSTLHSHTHERELSDRLDLGHFGSAEARQQRLSGGTPFEDDNDLTKSEYSASPRHQCRPSQSLDLNDLLSRANRLLQDHGNSPKSSHSSLGSLRRNDNRAELKRSASSERTPTQRHRSYNTMTLHNTDVLELAARFVEAAQDSRADLRVLGLHLASRLLSEPGSSPDRIFDALGNSAGVLLHTMDELCTDAANCAVLRFKQYTREGTSMLLSERNRRT